VLTLTCNPFAIRLVAYQCLSCTSVPSVALHVVEFTFLGGFESLPLRQNKTKGLGVYRRESIYGCEVPQGSNGRQRATPIAGYNWSMSVSDEETYMFAERYAHFSNVHTIYRDLLSGHYKPSVNMSQDGEWDITNVGTTAMFLLYAYFYSMVEDDPQGVNGFRVWRAKWPEEEKAIAAVEALVSPFLPGLKLFRNRMGFHGSRSRTHE
jgi:hypothetical protein